MAAAVKIPDVVWERHESEIRSFFPPQSKKRVKLVELMEHMERRGLYASIPQWKRRLDIWGLTKQRGLKRKASALDSNRSPVTGQGALSHEVEQMPLTVVQRTRLENQMGFPTNQWAMRFVNVGFQSQLYGDIFDSAQALFEHTQLPRPGSASPSFGTRTMTEALFLLQRLNDSVHTVDKEQLSEFGRHIDILTQNASISIKRDGPAFFHIAAFFLRTNSIPSESEPGILPLLIGCLHNVCEDSFGYYHHVTTMMRSLCLSATFGGKKIGDIHPMDWKVLRTVQVIDLICWPRKDDEHHPLRRRGLQFGFGVKDLLNICGLPKITIAGAKFLIPKPGVIPLRPEYYSTTLRLRDQRRDPLRPNSRCILSTCWRFETDTFGFSMKYDEETSHPRRKKIMVSRGSA